MAYKDTTTPWARYVQHRANATHRGIQFLITFEQWWELWSPHWHRRGKGAGRLVMARNGDTGAYEIGNVSIVTQEHNSHTKRGVRPHTMTKLREEDIPRIRELIAAGIGKQSIGERYGVSRNAIRQIADGRTWKNQ